MNADIHSKPWLLNEQWASREIVGARPVGGCVFALAMMFFGISGIGLVISGAYSNTSRSNIFMGGFLLAVVGFIAYQWVRGAKYGDSVCRLHTLPGVIGGWFKADVECSLPTESIGPVTAQLKNIACVGRTYSCIWEMTQEVDPSRIVTNEAGRSIVQIKMQLPRHPAQEPLSTDSASHTSWKLVVRKQAPGLDFVAEFDVPIYDISDAPESEQRPE